MWAVVEVLALATQVTRPCTRERVWLVAVAHAAVLHRRGGPASLLMLPAEAVAGRPRRLSWTS